MTKDPIYLLEMDKIYILFIFILTTLIIAGAQCCFQPSDGNIKYLIKLKGLKCELYDTTSAEFIACYIKPVSRTITTFNFIFNVLKLIKMGLSVQIV
jgi:hypothetical protein